MTESKVILVHEEKKGRCLVASENVSQGDILLVSKPYALIPSVTRKDSVCASCMRISNGQTAKRLWISCRRHCLHVLYCSFDCEEQHWNNFHRYECSFLDRTHTLPGHNADTYVINYAQLIMRMLTQRLLNIDYASPNGTVDRLSTMVSHFDEFTNAKKEEFRTVAEVLTEFVLTKLIPQQDKDDDEFLHSIASFLPDSPDVQEVEIVFSEVWLTDMAHLYSVFSAASAVDTLKCLLKKIYILICIEEINGFFLSTFAFNGYSQPPEMYALGVYPLAVFFNHSCSPNVDRCLVGDDLVFFATHSLQKNEELCISYAGRKCHLYTQNQVSPEDIINNQALRRQQLRDTYFFDCECVRCISEANGKLDQSFMASMEGMKCKKPNCQGWLIPSSEGHMHCEACGASNNESG